MNDEARQEGARKGRGERDTETPADHRVGGVTIGDVGGGIHGATLAGRDVIETTIDRLVYNVFEDRAQLQEQGDRAAVLASMRRIWIDHALTRGPSGPARAAPILEVWSDAVFSPWDMIVDRSGEARERLPAGATVAELFLTGEGSLLLLGEPGVGKTLALLELARQAITRAQEDPVLPIPVVLDLAWWTDARQTLSAWLLDMCHRKYGISWALASAWLENDELALFLDNLDRIAPSRQREGCVRAINGFLQEHGLMPVVVCCRTAEYEKMNTRLQLQDAVCLHRGESTDQGRSQKVHRRGRC